jgi:phage-related minor tail protein
MNDEFDAIASTDVGHFQDVRAALDGINISAARVSRTMTRTFANAIVSGKSFEAVLKSVALSLSKIALNGALQPVQQGLSSLVRSAFTGFTAAGGGSAPPIAPFAEGGIVSSPVYFGSNGSIGLMGERGAEAIVPLSRGPDGKLGLAADSSSSKPVQVSVNISTPDIAGFQKSQVQVAGAIARAVERGRRTL